MIPTANSTIAIVTIPPVNAPESVLESSCLNNCFSKKKNNPPIIVFLFVVYMFV